MKYLDHNYIWAVLLHRVLFFHKQLLFFFTEHSRWDFPPQTYLCCMPSQYIYLENSCAHARSPVLERQCAFGHFHWLRPGADSLGGQTIFLISWNRWMAVKQKSEEPGEAACQLFILHLITWRVYFITNPSMQKEGTHFSIWSKKNKIIILYF